MAIRIMVVDDEPLDVYLVKNCLEANDYQVLPFTVPEEAAKCAEEQHLDGAVLDVSMPGMNGFSLAERIRASTLNAGIAIVMLTGHDDVETVRKSFFSGATRFLSKPFNRDKLLDALVRARVSASLGERHHARVPLETVIQCKCEDSQFKARMLDISEGGVLLRSPFTLSLNSRINLQFDLPKVISYISPASRVVRIVQPHHMGLAFVDLHTNQRRALRDFVALENSGSGARSE
jgi:CheY-like chemotaxis protein